MLLRFVFHNLSEFIVQASQPQRSVERFGRQSRPDLYLHAALRLDIKIIVAIYTFIVSNGQAYGTGKLVCRNRHFISAFNGTDFDLQIHFRIIHILLLVQTVVVMVHPARFVRIVYADIYHSSTCPLQQLGKRCGKTDTAVITGNADRFVPVINHGSVEPADLELQPAGSILQAVGHCIYFQIIPPPLPEKSGCHHRPCEYNSAAPSSVRNSHGSPRKLRANSRCAARKASPYYTAFGGGATRWPS